MALVTYTFTVSVPTGDAGAFYTIGTSTNGARILPLPPSVGRVACCSVNKEDANALPGGGTYDLVAYSQPPSNIASRAVQRAGTQFLNVQAITPVTTSVNLGGQLFNDPDRFLSNSGAGYPYPFVPSNFLSSPEQGTQSPLWYHTYLILLDGAATSDHVFRINVTYDPQSLTQGVSPEVATTAGDPAIGN